MEFGTEVAVKIHAEVEGDRHADDQHDAGQNGFVVLSQQGQGTGLCDSFGGCRRGLLLLGRRDGILDAQAQHQPHGPEQRTNDEGNAPAPAFHFRTAQGGKQGKGEQAAEHGGSPLCGQLPA